MTDSDKIRIIHVPPPTKEDEEFLKSIRWCTGEIYKLFCIPKRILEKTFGHTFTNTKGGR